MTTLTMINATGYALIFNAIRRNRSSSWLIVCDIRCGLACPAEPDDVVEVEDVEKLDRRAQRYFDRLPRFLPDLLPFSPVSSSSDESRSRLSLLPAYSAADVARRCRMRVMRTRMTDVVATTHDRICHRYWLASAQLQAI